MLTAAIDRYLELRRALGYKLETDGQMLHSFARFAGQCGDSHLQSHTALAWAARAATPRQRDKRTRALVGLGRFLHAEDPGHEIPPRLHACAAHNRPLPYILSPEQIGRLVEAAAQLRPRRSMRPLTFSTLFGLLAVSGLRVSEALHLRFDDLRPDALVIRETKFHKSRLVPLHPSTAAALTRYLERRQCVVSNHDHLFLSLKRRPLCYETVRRAFREVCAATGMQQVSRLRLHDLRHSMAVRALEACPHGRSQVTPHVLALSTYLGHASVRGTYWYLQGSPRLMRDVAAVAEAWMGGAQS